MLFRDGYRSRFPKRPQVAERQVEEAKQRDKERKAKENAKQNASKWRQYPAIIQGNEVLPMRFKGKTKFKSLYEPAPYTVIDVKGTQYTLLQCNTQHPRQPIIRHASQIKLYQQPARSSPPHSRPAQAKPQYSNTAYDLWGSIAHKRNCASINQSDPTAHSANEDLTPDQTDKPTIPTPPLPLVESHDGEQPAQHEASLTLRSDIHSSKF
eukprot:gene5121-5769_t